MRIISLNRAEGKSAILVKLSAKKNIPIVAPGRRERFYKELADEFGVEIPDIIRPENVADADCTEVLIDDIDMVFKQLWGKKVIAGSITEFEDWDTYTG